MPELNVLHLDANLIKIGQNLRQSMALNDLKLLSKFAILRGS